MSKDLSNSERLRILKEYLNGSSSKYAFQKKDGLSSGSVYTWLRKFGLSDKVQETTMKSKVTAKRLLSQSEQEELALSYERSHSLKIKLRKEQLGHKVYKMLVDLAEETYGIEIRKNSGAK